MTKQTRAAIGTLGHSLKNHYWFLRNGTIRCEVIEQTDEHEALILCPISTAITCMPYERIRTLLADPKHAPFAVNVKNAEAEIRQHLKNTHSEIADESLEAETTIYATAAVIHDSIENGKAGVVLDLDAATVKAIAEGADDPHSDTSQALVLALSSENNELRTEYEAANGKMNL